MAKADGSNMSSDKRDIPELDEFIRANPAYRDTPIGDGTFRPKVTLQRTPVPIRSSDHFPWKLFGLPQPRTVLRALLIDGYPRELRRWAFERLNQSFMLLAFSIGMLCAGCIAWFGARLEWAPTGILILVLACAAIPGMLAAVRLIPIFSAIRYAARWRRHAHQREDDRQETS